MELVSLARQNIFHRNSDWVARAIATFCLGWGGVWWQGIIGWKANRHPRGCVDIFKLYMYWKVKTGLVG